MYPPIPGPLFFPSERYLAFVSIKCHPHCVYFACLYFKKTFIDFSFWSSLSTLLCWYPLRYPFTAGFTKSVKRLLSPQTLEFLLSVCFLEAVVRFFLILPPVGFGLHLLFRDFLFHHVFHLKYYVITFPRCCSKDSFNFKATVQEDWVHP